MLMNTNTGWSWRKGDMELLGLANGFVECLVGERELTFRNSLREQP